MKICETAIAWLNDCWVLCVERDQDHLLVYECLLYSWEVLKRVRLGRREFVAGLTLSSSMRWSLSRFSDTALVPSRKRYAPNFNRPSGKNRHCRFFNSS